VVDSVRTVERSLTLSSKVHRLFHRQPVFVVSVVSFAASSVSFAVWSASPLAELGFWLQAAVAGVSSHQPVATKPLHWPGSGAMSISLFPKEATISLFPQMSWSSIESFAEKIIPLLVLYPLSESFVPSRHHTGWLEHLLVVSARSHRKAAWSSLESSLLLRLAPPSFETASNPWEAPLAAVVLYGVISTSMTLRSVGWCWCRQPVPWRLRRIGALDPKPHLPNLPMCPTLVRCDSRVVLATVDDVGERVGRLVVVVFVDLVVGVAVDLVEVAVDLVVGVAVAVDLVVVAVAVADLVEAFVDDLVVAFVVAGLVVVVVVVPLVSFAGHHVED
jgi:hypothetical protein